MIKNLPYEIIIESGLLAAVPEHLKLLAGDAANTAARISRYVIITDDTTRKLFGEQLSASMKSAGLQVDLLAFPHGEKSKSREAKAVLEDQMLELQCKRDTMIIALGGGVVGDLSGFVAATFMRGIPYIQIPTTLLAMVDSSVGGKTAIDTPRGKNLIGAFWPPAKVLIDPSLLKTLPQEHLIGGLVEAIKMFMTSDAASLEFAQKNMQKILAKDPQILAELIQHAVQIKADVVADDEREKGKRAILNFGHTVGHAAELLSDFKTDHGHAVALGIAVETKIASLVGHLPDGDFQAVIAILKGLNFDLTELNSLAPEAMIDAMELDKKSRGHLIKYVVLTGLGQVLEEDGQFAHSLDTSIFKQAIHGW